MKAPTDRNAWLKGGDARCLNPPGSPPGFPWRLVLLGPPGVGKGAQADLLCARLGACHLSTGDIFRAAGKSPDCEHSPALREALGAMHRGALVPDATVMAVVAERKRCLHCKGGFVLDGFPRTVAQAEALENLLKEEGVGLDAVFDYQISEEENVARLSGRRVCPACKAGYHAVGRPPREAGVCDACGTPLVQRDDDRPEAVRERMKAYRETIAPLLDFYGNRGLLVIIPADGSPEKVYERAWRWAMAVRPWLEVSHLSRHAFAETP